MVAADPRTMLPSAGSFEPADLHEPWWPSRYGPDDQLGTLNEITPAHVVRAARLVRQGISYDLGRTLHADVPSFPGRFWRQTLVSASHLTNPRRERGTEGGWGKNRVNWVTRSEERRVGKECRSR